STLPAGAGGGPGRRAGAEGTPASLPACRSAIASTSSAPHSWVNGKVKAAKPIPNDAPPQERIAHRDALRAKPGWWGRAESWPLAGRWRRRHGTGWLRVPKRDRERAPQLGDTETLTASEVHHLHPCSPTPCPALWRNLLAHAQTNSQTARSFEQGGPEASTDLVCTARALRPTGAGPWIGPAASAGTCIWRRARMRSIAEDWQAP